MITKYYKNQIVKDSYIKANILSWSSDVKDNQLPIINISFSLILHLLKCKLKYRKYKIGLCVTQSLNKDKQHFDFFKFKLK
jgi:hypothetical protein